MRILVTGNVDHGKTTLLLALNHVLYSKYKVGSAGSHIAPLTVSVMESVPFSINGTSYTFVDYPGYADYMNMFDAGQEKFDAALIVCSAADGPMRETRDLIQKCLEYGIEKYVLFMNMTDLIPDEDLVEFATEEAILFMEDEGYSQEFPVIKGSALKALEDPEKHGDCFVKLISAVHKVCTQ